MLAPTRPAAPAPRRRALARGSLVGVGLLALTSSAMPAALADDAPVPTPPDTTPEGQQPARAVLVGVPEQTPISAPLAADFGTGKQFDLTLQADGAVPDGTSLAGAQFAFTAQGSTAATATCTTTATGSCSVGYGTAGSGTTAHLPSGTYSVQQVAAVDGLTPLAGVVGSFTMSYSAATYVWPTGYQPNHRAIEVRNVSQYAQQVTAAVVDAETGDPLEGVDFSLTSAEDVEVPVARAVDAGADEPVVESSDEDGIVTFDGWFLPSDLTLVPAGVPDGYVLGEPVPLTIPANPGLTTPGAWALAEPLRIARVVPETPAPTSTPAPTTASAPSATSTPPPSSTGTSSPVAVPPVPAPSAATVGAQRATAAASAAPVAEDSVAPVAPLSLGTPPLQPSSTPQRSTAQTDELDSPALETASSGLPDPQLIALGVGFVLVVGAGFGVLVWRRARRG